MIAVFLMAFFEPNFFVKIHVFHLTCQVISVIAILYIGVMCYLKDGYIKKITFLTIFCGMFMMISSILNGNFEMSVFRRILAIIGVSMFFDICKFDEIRKAVLYVLFLLTSVNLILHMFTNEMVVAVLGEGEWFLTGSNALIIYCFPAVSFAIASINENRQTKLAFVTIIINMVTAFLSDTATTQFVLLMLILSWMITKYFRINIFKIKYVVGFVMVCFLLFILLQVQDKVFVVRFIIEDILKRDITFTSRTYIWTESIRQFLASPFIGHGSGNYSFHVMVNDVGFWADHAHNHFLQQLIQGGIIQFSLFIAILYEVIKYIKTVPGRFGSWCSIVFLFLGVTYLFESYTNAIMYSVFYLICSYGRDNKRKFRGIIKTKND